MNVQTGAEAQLPGTLNSLFGLASSLLRAADGSSAASRNVGGPDALAKALSRLRQT